MTNKGRTEAARVLVRSSFGRIHVDVSPQLLELCFRRNLERRQFGSSRNLDI